VAGSWVVETTRTGGRPGAAAACVVRVGGTGQNAQSSSGALPVNGP
jgi:hypothetical protein